MSLPTTPPPAPGRDPQTLYPPYPGTGYPPVAYPADYQFAPLLARSHRLRTVLIVVGVLAVVLVGGSVAAAVQVWSHIGSVAAHTHVLAPDTLGGRARITTPQMQASVDEAITSIKANLPRVRTAVGGVYGNISNRDMVMVIAVTATITDPGSAMAQFTRGVSDGAGALTNVAPVSPGPLGGVAQCGETSISGVGVTACTWADHGSLGVIITYFVTDSTPRDTFAALRGEVEQRS